MAEEIYDFIIVGAGPAGCTLASTLARTIAEPRVLLLEAGSKNDDKSHRVVGKRWMTFQEESMNWGYKTTPQDGCDGRVLDYSRGKGLGGGSEINFGLYSVGARDDYESWAEIVGDEGFGWGPMQRRFKSLETFGMGAFLASKEVILCAGSLDSPKILMHSGIGPASELKKFDIQTVHDIPAIGQGLKDHFFAPLLVSRNPETNDRNAFFKSETAMADAMKQWEEDGTGPWSKYGCQLTIGWFKSDTITSTDEFKALPKSEQEFMNRETIPHYEIVAGFPIHLLFPGMLSDYSYTCLAVFLMNEQSAGEVRLQSSNPDDPLLFDPKILSHPFDQRAVIHMYRHLLEISKHPSFAKDTLATILGPKSESDDDILQFWKDHTSSSWHMMGTVKMGRTGDSDAAVDSGFRVFGVEGLRVADMSVVPVLTNNHTQATAYVTGATCADVLIREYGLDQ
ncbi:hypothetical protein N7481_007032 [Penicillium waksmanii]|uniref:uncharacterized protein n=1 Tax=Penicillium waksmanii TaxID=69791 RepID=UPI002549818F|nr:uncharacterized protein N7481_007032 [Penicillium waksmanii]KAJ5979734.1 hypothetical protein N7481_007032 [Penicillium waksmanii]